MDVDVVDGGCDLGLWNGYFEQAHLYRVADEEAGLVFQSELSMLSRYLLMKLAMRFVVSDVLSNRRSSTEPITCSWASLRSPFVSVLRL